MKKIRRPNPNSLPYFVALAVIVALVIGGGLFWIMYTLFIETEGTTLYDITRTVITALAALTVGGAAIIQYRKHKITEIALVDRQAAQAAHQEAPAKQLQAQLQAHAAQQEAQAKQLQAQLQAQADTHDAKMSERLSMAIEHLGDKNLHIRVGALYELRRLAEDSQRDRASIQEIVTQFLSGKRDEIEGISRKSAENLPKSEYGRIEYTKLPQLPSDITVALKTLFFLFEKYREDYDIGCEISWEHLDARYLSLDHLPFVHMNLNYAHFDHAKLTGSNLDGARLADAHFDGAWLFNTHFDDAWLFGAHFDGAKLYGADFSKARSIAAEQFENVVYDEDTIFPADFKLPESA
ncbi:MAG: pentapeptide repeat-containing protein [Oscillospiraceae bacterium]|nr:pentapeptide repeat-containing protein [Oscillospiraceae bacterium]